MSPTHAESGSAPPPTAAASTPTRVLAAALLALGGLLLAASVFADQLQLSSGGDGVGWVQLLGAIVGLVLLLVGVAWLARPGTMGEEPLGPAEE